MDPQTSQPTKHWERDGEICSPWTYRVFEAKPGYPIRVAYQGKAFCWPTRPDLAEHFWVYTRSRQATRDPKNWTEESRPCWTNAKLYQVSDSQVPAEVRSLHLILGD